MPVTIDGTNGITNGGGYTGDGVSFADATPANTLVTTTGGNVGIGTSSPSYKVDVAGVIQSKPASGTFGQIILNNQASGSWKSLLSFHNGATAKWELGVDPANNGTNSLYFWDSAASSTRMLIDSAGNVAIANTNRNGGGKLNVLQATAVETAISGGTGYAGDVSQAAQLLFKYDNNTTTSQVFLRFAVNNNTVACGQINANGSGNVAFGGWSDRRLKENITDLPPQLENICALRPVEFDYIASEGGGHQIGFIAQEMEEVYPDVIGERSDGMLTITGWSKTEARLVKAIQEQQAIIEDLRARLAAVEGAIA